jgi:hypothetical protein
MLKRKQKDNFAVSSHKRIVYYIYIKVAYGYPFFILNVMLLKISSYIIKV